MRALAFSILIGATLLGRPAVTDACDEEDAHADAQRAAERAQREAHRSAERAQREAHRDMERARREAQRAAERAQRDAQRAHEQAMRDRDRALRDAARAREHAMRDAKHAYRAHGVVRIVPPAPAEHVDLLGKIDRLERRLGKLRRTVEKLQAPGAKAPGEVVIDIDVD